MTFTNSSREQYVAERMDRFKATAQCQCAAHYSRAMQQAVEEWEGMQKLEAWFKTPEGIKAKEGFQKYVDQLSVEKK